MAAVHIEIKVIDIGGLGMFAISIMKGTRYACQVMHIDNKGESP